MPPILVLALCATVMSRWVIMAPPDDMSTNQAIQEAANTSKSMEFIQDDDTLMVDLDMKMTRQDWEEYHGNPANNGRQKRKGISNRRWTDNTVIYERIPFSGRDKNTIMQAFEEYHRHTCIKFKPRSGSSYGRIYFTDGGGCSSYVGMYKGRQPVTLARGCRHKGIVMHELGHAVGLHHEQTRPDRDDYVTINFRNIAKDMAFNFEKNRVDNLGVPYSYLSVMHYDQYSFSTNGRVTIIAKQKEYQKKMGNRKGFDFADIKILNLMYKCSSHCQQKSCPREGFLGKDCKCWCPGNPVKECGGRGGGGGGGGSRGGGGGSRGGGGNSCTDDDRLCRDWSKQGYCTNLKYSYWMRENCKLSCGVCGRAGSYSRGDDCLDQFSKCPQWAENGECKTNPTYMNDFCRKSCKSCSSSYSRQSCEDTNASCGVWASRGMCEQNKEYMEKTCGKSCNPDCKGKF